MKLYRIFTYTAWSLLAAVGLMGCSDDEQVDNREHDYGYVQFKLYKAASYEPQSDADGGRGMQFPLDYLSDAAKVQVVLAYGATTVKQTLTLQAAEGKAAEYGLRSEKLKLQTGAYRVLAYTLYDVNDEPIYNGTLADEQPLEVISGGLTIHDLMVEVAERGSLQFTLTKDFSDFGRAVTREYTFDEIATVSITVRHKVTNRKTTFERLKTKFSVHFDEGDETGFGYQTSSSLCDTLLWLPAGEYALVGYEAYDSSKILLESNQHPTATEFTVSDNQKTEVDVPVKLYEADGYIKDYYALREIWEALDGPNWYYVGENFATGVNWDFTKDVDLWGAQPGVELHSNGRVARLDISNFAFRGAMPAALGALTELIELYLGTHNDTNLMNYDPTIAKHEAVGALQQNRLERHKEYLATLYPGPQLSEPCARALKEHNISTPATRLYETMSEAEIFDTKSGAQRIHRYDTTHGVLANGLSSLPAEIGKLTKLTTLNIANSAIAELPAEMEQLVSCTDLEIYNCPNMKQFPMSITRMPELVSLNLSNNKQWSAEEIYKGLSALAIDPATGALAPSAQKIQILYARENSLEELPVAMAVMEKMSLLDLAYNNISKLHALGKKFSPVQLYLDHNQIESMPVDSEGYFCGYADSEAFSVSFNKLTKMPNIFSAKANFTMKSVDFSGNDIRGFEGEENGAYRGIRVETLSLSQNPNLKKYPTAFKASNSLISYIILRACGLEEIPEGAFTYSNVIDLVSFDLSYNMLTELPKDFHAGNMPYLYGVDLSYNCFSEFPYRPLDASGLTVLAVRAQRDANGKRCLREWPTGIYQHVGLRGLYLGSNDLRVVDDTISTLCYYLDISDNPNIVFDASDICYAWQVGAYILIYDKTQNIINCDLMLD